MRHKKQDALFEVERPKRKTRAEIVQETRAARPNFDPRNPRCDAHAEIPLGVRGPACSACADVRAYVKRNEGLTRMQGWDDFSITGSGMHVPGLATVNDMARRRDARGRLALPGGDDAA